MWRSTPQTLLVKHLLEQKGHATNQELAAEARKTFPRITNTTVHRITSRLVAAKSASYAPSLQNVKVVDANTSGHDHFVCQLCGRIVDIHLPDEAFRSLQSQLPGKLSRHNVLVAGMCEQCHE